MRGWILYKYPEAALAADAYEMRRLLKVGRASGLNLEVVTQEQFDKAYQTWAKLIQSGKQTAENVIKTAESKYPLTDDQKAKIRGVQLAAQDGEMSQEEIDAIRQREMQEATK